MNDGAAFLCPACGEPLDDYAPCACALAPPPPARRWRPHGKTWNMRTMVAEKIARQAIERGKP